MNKETQVQDCLNEKWIDFNEIPMIKYNVIWKIILQILELDSRYKWEKERLAQSVWCLRLPAEKCPECKSEWVEVRLEAPPSERSLLAEDSVAAEGEAVIG